MTKVKTLSTQERIAYERDIMHAVIMVRNI
jgi:hypothetical protein